MATVLKQTTNTDIPPPSTVQSNAMPRLGSTGRTGPRGASGDKASYEPFPFYLTAWEEDKHVVGQANIELDENSYIVNERNAARKAGEFILAHREEIDDRLRLEDEAVERLRQALGVPSES